MVESELAQTREAIVARSGCEHGRAGALGELDRGQADTTRAGLNEDRLARLQTAELEQAVVGGPERDRHAGNVDEVGTVGYRPRHDRGCGGPFGV